MGYSIQYLPNALRQLKRLDPPIAERIFDAMDAVAALDNPRSRGKLLTGPMSGLWRYRVGDWRVICDIVDDRLIVLVVMVAPRDKVYRTKR